MTSVTDFYKKDCDRNEAPTKTCRCIPSYKRGEEKLCKFSDHLLVTNLDEKLSLLRDFGYILPGDNREEANSYIEEYPIFVLKKGTILCHSTYKEKLFNITENSIEIPEEPLWWEKYYVGQKKYNGGWFTYETSYGGPDFGVNLYYKVEQDIPLLFVPNYRLYVLNESYFPRDCKEKFITYLYSGSHIVKGPYNWKQKGFPEIIPKYYADEFAERLVSLGFFGYISCDECEVFLTHDTMKKAMYNRPFQSQVIFEDGKEELNQRILDSMCVLFSKNKKCSLKVTTDRDRQTEKTYFNLWNLEAISGPETEPKMSVDESFNRYWKMNGILHREDGPAVIRNDGSKQWYFLGILHREDGPAVIEDDGKTQIWYKNGYIHRKRGPAVVRADGTEEWWRYGERHRKHGPAVINRKDGIAKWYWYGNLHREDDKPAIEYRDGSKEWYRDGNLHREGGPALINHKDGLKMWYKDGELHRESDKPAIVYRDGSKEWWRDGKLHREGRPAIIRADGTEEWWRDGNPIRIE